MISVPESQTEAAASEFQEKLLLRDMDTLRIGDLPATVILMRFFCVIFIFIMDNFINATFLVGNKGDCSDNLPIVF